MLMAGASFGFSCGSPSSTPQDASTEADASLSSPDGGSEDGFGPNSTNVEAAIVLVDGIGDATMQLTNDAGAIPFDDVRVCIFDSSNHPLTKYAVPDDTPIPQTNYPGVSLGRGADLGSFAAGAVTIDVFSAGDLQSDAAWETNRTAYECTAIACNGGACRLHGEFNTALVAGMNVIALGNDAATGHVNLSNAHFDDIPYAGGPNELYGTVVDFSGWHVPNRVAVSYGDWTAAVDAGTGTSIVDPLGTLVALSPKLIGSLASYDAIGLQFVAYGNGKPVDAFGESLDSIAYVSNPNVDPITFYGARANFVFALVGDPSNATSVLANGGRDPSFDRIGLHVIAIPYAPPVPLPPADE
jgi:hypothetical protein